MTLEISTAELEINGEPTGRRFADFVNWFYDCIDTPVLRGTVLEFLLVDYLIKNAALIAGDRMSFHTGFPVQSQKSLEKSLRKYYATQPHGDVFDVQLHWGITVEIKTTSSTDWSIAKTSSWDIWIDENLKDVSKGFQAQYYVLAKLDGDGVKKNLTSVDFGNLDFYVLSGRELDQRANGNSIGLNRFLDGLTPCNISNLAAETGRVVNAELERIQAKFCPDRIRLSYQQEGCIPIARHTSDGIQCAWYKMPTDREAIEEVTKALGNNAALKQKRDLYGQLWEKREEISWPWVDTYDPSPRDWAVAGLLYLDHRDQKQLETE